MLWLESELSILFELQKKLTEKYRECDNRKSQPTPDTKRKRKRTEKKTHTRKIDKNAREAHRPAPFSPTEAYWAILLSFNFTYTVQTRPCTNEALEGYSGIQLIY